MGLDDRLVYSVVMADGCLVVLVCVSSSFVQCMTYSLHGQTMDMQPPIQTVDN